MKVTKPPMSGKEFLKDTFNDVVDGLIEGGLQFSANYTPSNKRTFLNGSTIGVALPFHYHDRNIIITHNIAPVVSRLRQRTMYVQELINETVANANALDC